MYIFGTRILTRNIGKAGISNELFFNVFTYPCTVIKIDG